MPPPNSEDRTLVDALAAYRQLAERGAAPDRWTFAAQYPSCADELFRLLNSHPISGCVSRSSPGATKLRMAETVIATGPDSMADLASTFSVMPGSRKLGGFVLLEQIGAGRQGLVYRARQQGTNRIVALKVIREGAFATDEVRRRFENEIQLASRLNHPGIVAILECGRDASHDYFAMEFIDGVPLDRFCKGCSLNHAAIVELFTQVCRAVGFAHEHAVLHRDLKPGNVLVDRSGRPHVLDFGLAKAIGEDADASANVTQVGDFAGTWTYASPEQVRLDPALLDVRSDVYSLGVILYELLTGCLPYSVTDQPHEIKVATILNTPPQPPSQIQRAMDRDLETIVLRALSKEPVRRYASATALADDLERFQAGQPIEARRDDTWYVLSRILRRNRWKVAGVGATVVSLALTSVVVSVLYSQSLAARDEALRAQSTTNTRLDLVLNSRDYSVRHFDQTQRTANDFAAVSEANADLPALRRHRKPLNPEFLALLSGQLPEIPKDLLQAMRSDDNQEHEKATEWFEARTSEIEVIQMALLRTRPVFPALGVFDSTGVWRQRPQGLAQTQLLSGMLIAHATWRFQSLDSNGVVQSLESARELACAVGDGCKTDHKAFSVDQRDKIYEFVRWILEQGPPMCEPYLDWIVDDPPLPTFGYSIMLEREELVHLLESSCRADKAQPKGFLDLDILNDKVDGYYDELGLRTNALRELGRKITPNEARRLIDDYLTQVEGLDLVPGSAFKEKAEELLGRLSEHPAFPMIAPILPSYRGPFLAKARCNTHRSATQLAANLRRYFGKHGFWPRTLLELQADNPRARILDPYWGIPFAYRIEDGNPILYSFNEDGEDNGGISGRWGETDTDLVWFRPSP